MHHSLHIKLTWFVVIVMCPTEGDYFWNVVCGIKLSTFIGWHHIQASPRLWCDTFLVPVSTSDVYNEKWFVASLLVKCVPALVWIMVDKVSNEPLLGPIGLVIRSCRHEHITLKNIGPVILSFSILSYFVPGVKFANKINQIPWLPRLKKRHVITSNLRRPLLLTWFNFNPLIDK